MISSERAELVEWLLENCRGDEELEALIAALDRDGRGDLLLLIRCFRLPPYRLDEEIAKIVGTAEAVERGLIELEAIYRPIGEEHHKRRVEEAARNQPIEFYHNRLMTRKERCEWLVEDATWAIDREARELLGELLMHARKKPSVPFEGLAKALGVPAAQVLELLTILHVRFNERRRPPSGDTPDDRGGRAR